jgi:hypothetical protein
VLPRPLHRLLADLQATRADGSFARRCAKLCSVGVLVLDDFGLRPLSVQAAEDLYELIRERYERKPLVLTSNRALEEWPEAFGDGLLASAALDRLTHHCHTLVIRGQSYRQRARAGPPSTAGEAPSAERHDEPRSAGGPSRDGWRDARLWGVWSPTAPGPGAPVVLPGLSPGGLSASPPAPRAPERGPSGALAA